LVFRTSKRDTLGVAGAPFVQFSVARADEVQILALECGEFCAQIRGAQLAFGEFRFERSLLFELAHQLLVFWREREARTCTNGTVNRLASRIRGWRRIRRFWRHDLRLGELFVAPSREWPTWLRSSGPFLDFTTWLDAATWDGCFRFQNRIALAWKRGLQARENPSDPVGFSPSGTSTACCG
jgi:hypothetical protein